MALSLSWVFNTASDKEHLKIYFLFLSTFILLLIINLKHKEL